MFASKAQPDPFPYLVGAVRIAYQGTLDGEPTVHAPRPFDPNMRNEPNPILVEFRATLRNYRSKALCLAHYIEYVDGSVYGWTPDHIDHARKVLTRLAEQANKET